MTARRRVFLSAAALSVAAVVAVMLPAGPASARMASAAQTRVGAHDSGMIFRVGASPAVCAGEGRDEAVSQAGFAVGACVAAEDTTDVAAARGPSFIARSNGEVIRVPEGATGPTPTDNGLGFQFRGGSGGDPLDPRVTGVRVMDPVTSGKYLYPNGYVSYENGVGQTVNPFTGQTISPSDPFWHWALEP